MSKPFKIITFIIIQIIFIIYLIEYSIISGNGCSYSGNDYGVRFLLTGKEYPEIFNSGGMCTMISVPFFRFPIDLIIGFIISDWLLCKILFKKK
jgi:hypothetical protein